MFFFSCREIATRGPHGLESDVWSLGCMLYTLLVGKPPFDVSKRLFCTFLELLHYYLSPQERAKKKT